MSEAPLTTPDDPLEVEFANTLDDLRVLGRYGWRWWTPLAIVGATLVCTLPGAVYLAFVGHWIVAALVSLGFGGMALWLMYRNWHSLPKQHAKFLTSRRITLTPDELHQRTGETFGRWRWAYLREVVDYQGSLLIGVDHGWWVIPPSAFSSPEQRARFCGEVAQRQRAAQPLAPAEPLPPADLATGGLRVEFQNTPALQRAVFARAQGSRPDEWHAWIGLAIVLAACAAAMDAYPPQADPTCTAIGWLSAMLFHVTATLAVLLMATRSGLWLTRRRDWRHELAERVVITPDGVYSTTPAYHTFVRWDRFEGIEDDARAIYIIYVKAPAQMTAVPKSAFPNQAEAGRFLAAAREYLERSQAEQARRAEGASGRFASAQPAAETGNPYQAPGASS